MPKFTKKPKIIAIEYDHWVQETQPKITNEEIKKMYNEYCKHNPKELI